MYSITILGYILILVIACLIISILYNLSNNNVVTTRGANGVEGTVINMSCPVGKSISLTNLNPTTTRAALICSGDSTCDAFYNSSQGQNQQYFAGLDSNMQPAYIDLMQNDLIGIKSCAGKNNCSINVPLKTSLPSTSCLSRCNGQIQLISTYDCI